MIPMAVLIVLVGGLAFLIIGALFAKIGRLESRVEYLEKQHGELVGMISDAIINRGEKDSLELKLRSLLLDK